MAPTIIMHKIVGHGYDLLIVPFGLLNPVINDWWQPDPCKRENDDETEHISGEVMASPQVGHGQLVLLAP